MQRPRIRHRIDVAIFRILLQRNVSHASFDRAQIRFAGAG
jgi:hypothetical protein